MDPCKPHETTVDNVTLSDPTPVTAPKNKTVQSTLCVFRQADNFSRPNQGVRDILDGIGPKKHPKWVEDLLGSFQVESSETRKGKEYYTLKCILCSTTEAEPKSRKAQGRLSDKCAFTFRRHLETFHPQEYNTLQSRLKHKNDIPPSQQQPTLTSTFPPRRNTSPYGRTHPVQKRFNKDVLNFVTVDLVPFRIVAGSGFQNLVWGFDDKVKFPHPTTVERWLTKEYENTVTKIRGELQGMPDGSLHFILDIWSTQQRKSIMGVKVQYITDWKVRQLVVGFRHFPSAHTAENIRTLIHSLLADDMGLTPNQVGSVTADNATNILAAFPAQTDLLVSQVESPSENEEDEFLPHFLSHFEKEDGFMDVNPTQHDEGVPNDSNDVAEAETDPNSEEVGEEELAFEGLKDWGGNPALRRNSCLAHLLQLAIKDTIKANVVVTKIEKKINDLVRFFNISNKWSEELRSRSGGLNLVKPCVTRWNSLYLCLKRLIMEGKGGNGNPIDIPKAIREAVNFAKSDCKNKRQKFPIPLHDEDMVIIRILTELLEPLAVLTEAFQKDDATSSLVILGLINAVKSVSAINIVDEGNPDIGEIKNFQNRLIENVILRFSTDPNNSRDCSHTSRGRRIVTVDVFHNEVFIIASLLDNRIKTSCFEDTLFTDCDWLDGKVPKVFEAIQLLRTAFNKEVSVRRNEGNAECIQETSSGDSPQAAKKRKSMFDLVSSQSETSSSASRYLTSEVDSYLQLARDVGSSVDKISPLHFWLKHDDSFPVLAALARKYLGVPASSGAIERLFSVATSLGKTRNARLSPETIEKLLCVKYYKLNALR